MRYSLFFQASASIVSFTKSAAAEELAPDTEALLEEYPSFLRPALKSDVLAPAGLLEKRQQNGALCDTEDPLLLILESDAAATPFCSSFLQLPAETSYGIDEPTVTQRVTSTQYLRPSGTVIVTATVTASSTARLARRADPSEQDAALASAVSSACSCLDIPTSTVKIIATSPTVTHTRKVIKYADSPNTSTVYVTVPPAYSPTYSPPYYGPSNSSFISPSDPLRTGSQTSSSTSSAAVVPTYSNVEPPTYGSSSPTFTENSRTISLSTTSQPTFPVYTPPLYPTKNESSSVTPTFTDNSRTISINFSTATVPSNYPSSNTADTTCTETVTIMTSGNVTSYITPTFTDNSRTIRTSDYPSTSTLTTEIDVTVTATLTVTAPWSKSTATSWTAGPWNSTLSYPWGPTGTSPSISVPSESRTGSQGHPTYSTSTPLYPTGNTTTPSYPTGTGSSSTTSWTAGPWNSTLSSPTVGPTAAPPLAALRIPCQTPLRASGQHIPLEHVQRSSHLTQQGIPALTAPQAPSAFRPAAAQASKHHHSPPLYIPPATLQRPHTQPAPALSASPPAAAPASKPPQHHASPLLPPHRPRFPANPPPNSLSHRIHSNSDCNIHQHRQHLRLDARHHCCTATNINTRDQPVHVHLLRLRVTGHPDHDQRRARLHADRAAAVWRLLGARAQGDREGAQVKGAPQGALVQASG
ncbi:hypothetical protein FH972_023239 [Carpinus fangiana]|uniref:Uncharacterized protein n=1 Tax=Carpinus fangiana TaxID=176857 RepID=A0A5N6KUX9_9ROSI|nr:hypothetical protein FH972_023239 [Carpinus fangiana]